MKPAVRPLVIITVLSFFHLLPLGQMCAQHQTRLWKEYTDTLLVGTSDTLHLDRNFIRSESLEVVFIPAVKHDSTDVQLKSREGLLLFSRRLVDVLRQSEYRIAVRYSALPFNTGQVYSRRKLSLRGAVSGDSVQIATPAQPLSIESIFGNELNKSGYIGRGFTVGNDRDLNINSGFRLQLSGKLSDDISVMGALTDENTPIQPEGNTRTIQELDKVFIKITGRNMGATLGDFNIGYNDTEFGKYNRKLSGILGEVAWRDGDASVSYASLKGAYHSLQFNGIDGVQGPYRLTASNGKQPVLVLAGTERVYIDGVAMVRGETNDYVIEYSNGEITFTPQRLITSYSRITVDYEYAEREFTRSMLTASTRHHFMNSRLSVGARFIQESDDADNPIDQPLDDNDRAVLAEAGDNAALATRGGAVWAGYDTARNVGLGQYVAVDTLVGGDMITIYRYAPGSDSATWLLPFSFVGSGNGDYRRKAIGVFEYAGQRGGDYTPGRRLPLPRQHNFFNLTTNLSPLRNMTVAAEVAMSALDLNRLSTLDNDDNAGNATKLSLSWDNIRTPVGIVNLQGKYRNIGATFAPIDRIHDIEYNRKWDVSSAEASREETGEANAELSISEGVSLSTAWGMLLQNLYKSRRLEGGLRILDAKKDSSLPEINYRLEHIATNDEKSGTNSSWLRQLGESRYGGKIFSPRLRFEHEHRVVGHTDSDSLFNQSLAFYDIRPGIMFSGFTGMTVNADVGIRVEDAPLNGKLQQRSTDILQQYGLTLRGVRDLSATMALTLRDRSYNDEFAQLGEKNIQTILTRAQLRYAPFGGGITTDLLYEAGTERTSRLERVYLKVPLGQGNYVYAGDLNNNGIEDENEFEPTRYDGDYVLLHLPTDELFPVIDLRTSVRLRIQPERFIEDKKNIVSTALRMFSGETLLRIDEKSETPNTSDIYLLRLSQFLDDSNTVRGFQNLRQDFFLFERSAAFSVRMRYDERRGFSKYALSTERSYRREQSLRIKTQPLPEIGLQADLVFLDDAVHASDGGSRARDISSSELSIDFSYRPWSDVEIGFMLSSRDASDRLPSVPTEAAMVSQTLRGIVTFNGPGRLRTEIEHNSIDLSSDGVRFPYELTDGRTEGESWIWRLSFDYRLTSFMQATLSYIGRNEAARRPLHSARAEVKAFF